MTTSTGPPSSPSANGSPLRMELLTMGLISNGGVTDGRVDVMANSIV